MADVPLVLEAAIGGRVRLDKHRDDAEQAAEDDQSPTPRGERNPAPRFGVRQPDPTAAALVQRKVERGAVVQERPMIPSTKPTTVKTFPASIDGV